MHKMSKQFDQKTRSKYFDIQVLQRNALAAPEEDRPVTVFAQAYFSYVIARGKSYTAEFEELAALGHKRNVKRVIAEV